MVKKKKSVRKKINGKDLTIHFMPYSEIRHDDAIGRIRKIMGIILQGKIVILQGRLKPDEETRLIENTMTLIGNLKDFQGIEIASIDSEHQGLFDKMRKNIARILVGENDSITIIGPAQIVKEIKRNPKKIELMLRGK